jgi:endonuclease/exonuclease/phosphatase family metal-dependent hydrolase
MGLAVDKSMTKGSQLRILTYNVHRCLGRDRRLSVDRVSDVISEQEPDVVALQELDVNRARTGFVDQVARIAGALAMNWFYAAALEQNGEQFGNGILSRLPMRLRRTGLLPELPRHPGRERRAALWVDLEWDGRYVHFINTHLGLRGRERVIQADALLGADWLGHPDCAGPQILCGDLNSVPGTRAYRHLRRRLRDPFPWSGWPPGTFPSSYPLLRLDHVLFNAGWIVHSIRAPRTRLTRLASDHLPLVVDASCS